MNGILILAERLASCFAAETLRAGLLLVAVAALLRLLPRLAAAARSMLWTGVLILTTSMPFLPLGAVAEPARISGSTHVLHFAPVWSLAVAAVWLLGSLLRGFSLLSNAFELREIWRSATPVPNAAPLSVGIANGRTRTAVLCLSNAVARPSIIGFFSPRVLLPAALYPKLSPCELDHIVLHEMEHLRRFDDWRNLFQKIALVLFPLNPALLWIDRRLAVERELACDESVLAATRAPKSYASCLVHLAQEHAFSRHLSLALGAWERRSELARRVQGILAYRLSGTSESRSRRQGKAAAGALIAATALLGAALAHTPQWISFAAAPVPVVAAQPAAGPALYRTANLQAVARPRMVEAVAPMPSPAPSVSVKHVMRKRLVRVSAARRAFARPLHAKTFVLTSWVVTYAPPADDFAHHSLARPHFTFAIFNPGLSGTGAAPRTFSPDAFPMDGGIVIIQL